MNSKIIVGMLIVAILASGCIETVTNGRHSGQIIAVEKSGLIWKTWDVYVKSDISSSQEDKYCVEDEALLPQLEKLSKERAKITVLYRDEAIVMPWRCNEGRGGIITGIEP